MVLLNEMLYIALYCGLVYNQSMEDKYYTIYDIAKMLKVTPRTVTAMINRKQLNALNVGTEKRAHWRIFEGHYLKFLSDSYEEE